MRAKEIQPKKLVVFDIDDTLVNTQTKVHVIKDGQIIKSLNSHDFTHYKLQPGESFDFEDFRNAREFFEKSKPIIPMMRQLKQDIATGNKVVMVTARADFDDKELFLDTFRKYGVDIDKVHVYRAGNSKQGTTEERKKAIIKHLLDKDDYSKAIMYDDAKPNLHTFIELKQEHPRTRFYAWHVSPEGEASEYMREGMVSEKKRKRKPRWAAYGPGPFGGYGYDVGYSGDSGGGVGENFADGRKFVEPNFDVEWEEAERYPEFVKLGKDAWIELAKKGKAITINNAQDINNTDAADPDSFKLLHPEKQKRALAQLEKGIVEMPIVAVYSDGHKELIGGNTRLTAMMARNGRATIWAFRVPGKQGVAEGNEINRAVEDLVQQVDFVGIVYKIARQKYPQAKFEKLDDMRIQVDVSGENNDPFDYKNYQGFFVMGMTYSNDEGTEVGVLINDAYSGPYKGIILPAIKLATEKCLQLVPNATPTLWVDDDESGGIWNEIAKKLGYKFEILNEGKQGMAENFADGKVKGKSRPGRVKRAGASCDGSVTDLRKRAKNASGEKAKMYHWCANMKSGR